MSDAVKVKDGHMEYEGWDGFIRVTDDDPRWMEVYSSIMNIDGVKRPSAKVTWSRILANPKYSKIFPDLNKVDEDLGKVTVTNCYCENPPNVTRE